MNNPDEVLERLLKGLGKAEPSPGMETRILHAMESHSAQPSNWPLHAALAVCLSLAAVWCIATVKVLPPPAMPLSIPMYNPRFAGLEITAEPTLHFQPAARHPHAAAPVQTASFPAPPLPLTEQERLLLRLAHQRDASKEPALNPALHDAQMAKANEQFQQFFEIEDKEMRKQIE
jgi:hypothetical protein